jgi:hypothetical protein
MYARSSFIFLLLIFFSTVCYSQDVIKLAPAASAYKYLDLKLAAFAELLGLRIIVQPNSWIGQAEVGEKVIALKVRIENNCGQTLYIHSHDFSLIDPAKEKTYFALHLPAGEDTLDEPEFSAKPIQMSSLNVIPVFAQTKFFIAPYYFSIYSGVQPFKGSFSYEPFLYRSHFTYWKKNHLPTREMYEKVIPDGVLEHEGSIEGFLYFEMINLKNNSLHFTMNVKIKGENVIGVFLIPFEVTKEKRK